MPVDAGRKSKVTHVSYSSINLFLKNPLAWHSKYVLGIRDTKTTPAALTGTAFHKYAENRLGGDRVTPKSLCEAVAEQAILTNTDVDWGKTGSAEKSVRQLRALIGHFEDWLQKDGAWLEMTRTEGVELQVECKPRGLALPCKSFIDLLYTGAEGRLGIVDWKTKQALSESLTPVYMLQAVVYGEQIRKVMGTHPERMSFVELKASENKDGSPQIRILDYVYAERKEETKAVKHLINACIRRMNGRAMPLPNISDEYEGEKSFNLYLQSYNRKHYASPE